MAWIGPAIGAGASILGNMMSASGQQSTNAMSQANMLQQEQWQTSMSNTAMQRRVADMKAAGLNPVMAAGGPGATVGSVGQPNLQNPDQSFGALGNQISSAVGLATQNAQIDNLKAQADKTRMETAQSAASLPFTGDTAKQSLQNMRLQAQAIEGQAANLNWEANVNEQKFRTEGATADFQRSLLELKQQMGQLDVQRLQLGMPRLQDDAAWQKTHPALSGWLQSGAPQGLNAVVGSAAKAASLVP